MATTKAVGAIENGDSVKDQVSGFAGVVIGTAEYLTGCKQFMVSPQKLDKEGKMLGAEWFDEGRLVIIKKKVIAGYSKANVESAVAPGGPQPNAPKGRK